MGYRTVRVSDVTGAELRASEVVTVVVRSHPRITEPKLFDAGADELSPLKSMDALVVAELKTADGNVSTMTCTVEDFDRVVPLKVLLGAAGTRGRRKGFSPRLSG